MTDYTKTTDFAAKDSLPSGDSGKIIKGTEFETEFDNIATAIATKSNIASPTFTGTTTIPTVDINGGAIDAVTLGTNSAVTEAQVDNININGNTISSSDTNGNVNISPNGTGTVVINTDLDVDNINVNGNAIISTDTNGNIDLTPNGTGEVNISKVDIDSGAIDGTVIGAASAAAITGTTGQFDTSLNVDGTVTADGLTVDGGANLLTRTSSGAEIDVLEVRNNATAASTASTIKFVNSTAAGSNSGSTELVGIRTGTSTGDFKIRTSNSSGAMTDRMLIDSNGDISFYEDTGTTAKFFWDASAESLGIGTTDPNTTLHVSSTTTTKSVVETTGASSDALIEFTKGQGSGNTWSMGIDHSNSSAFSLAYLSNGSPSLTTHGLLTVDTSGNVGIGTTSPSAFGAFAVKSTGTQIALTATTGPATMLFDENGVDRFFIKSLSGSDGLAFVDADGSSERMRITSDGNVGIGETNPSTPLHVSTSAENVATFASTDTAARIVITDGTDTGYVNVSSGKVSLGQTLGLSGNNLNIDASGNVGIGTTTPAKKLTVFGTGAGNATVQIEGEGGADPFINFLANNTQHWSLGVDDSDADKFKLSKHSALGTNDYFVVDVDGHAIIPEGVTLGTAAGTYNADNTLDDYEEGTWTPAPTSGTLNSGATGSYVKIGNLVHIQGQLSFSANGTTNRINGLPFRPRIEATLNTVRQRFLVYGSTSNTAIYGYCQDVNNALFLQDEDRSVHNFDTADGVYTFAFTYET